MLNTVVSETGDDGSTLVTDLEHPGPDVAVLTVTGEVDTLTAPRLEAGLDRLIGCDGPVLVADLSAVTFLASSGLAALIQAAHRIATTDRTLRLVVTNRAVRRPLEITGTDQLFDMHTARDAAVPTVHD